MPILKGIYQEDADFTASVAAARINGYLGGYGKSSDLEKDLKEAGWSPETIKKLLAVLNRQRRY